MLPEIDKVAEVNERCELLLALIDQQQKDLETAIARAEAWEKLTGQGVQIEYQLRQLIEFHSKENSRMGETLNRILHEIGGTCGCATLAREILSEMSNAP